jgi:hypothetical protein
MDFKTEHQLRSEINQVWELYRLQKDENAALKARLAKAEGLLSNLVTQITKGNPIDDHGHDFKMNRSYLEAQAFLSPTTSEENP